MDIGTAGMPGEKDGLCRVISHRCEHMDLLTLIPDMEGTMGPSRDTGTLKNAGEIQYTGRYRGRQVFS
jgi:hypothetical protein